MKFILMPESSNSLNREYASSLSASENSKPTDVLTIMDDVAKVKVSVSDGSKDTFAKSYTPTEIYELIMSIEE